MNEKTEAETIADIAAASLQERLAGRDDAGLPYTVVPEKYRIQDLEHLLPAPSRIKTSTDFVSLESFGRYVNDFKSPTTRIVVGRTGNAKAIIDGHGKDAPAWESHHANFLLSYSERWTTWDKSNKAKFGQKQFAEFVEDNLSDFLNPKGSEMLDIAKTLTAEQSSSFKSAVRLDNGDTELKFIRTTVGKAGQTGNLEIPAEFDIAIPVIEGEPARTIPVRLRYDLSDDGKLTLAYDIIRRSALLEEVRRSVVVTIANDTRITPFLVV